MGAVPGTAAYVEQNFGRIASFGDRLLSYFYDGLLGLAILLPMLIAIPVWFLGFLYALSQSENGQGDHGVGTYVVVASSLAMSFGWIPGLLLIFWNRIYRAGTTGQSLGKKWTGLVLIDTRTGAPIGVGQALLRELIYGVADSVVLIGHLWMPWDENRQTLGDKVANSIVIHAPPGHPVLLAQQAKREQKAQKKAQKKNPSPAQPDSERPDLDKPDTSG